MHLVQILLPIADNAGNPFSETALGNIQKDLCDRFGGLTAYNRAPAEGVWRNDGSNLKDDIIIVEVMVDELDRTWWRGFKTRVEAALGQNELVIRAHAVERL